MLHALATGTPATVYATARGFAEQEWAATVAALAERGLAQPDGRLTEAGRETKDEIESRTDALAATAYAALEDGEVEELIRALRPVTTAVVAAGEIPRQSPMGLDLDDSLR